MMVSPVPTRRLQFCSRWRFISSTFRNGRSQASSIERSPRCRSDQIHVVSGTVSMIGMRSPGSSSFHRSRTASAPFMLGLIIGGYVNKRPDRTQACPRPRRAAGPCYFSALGVTCQLDVLRPLPLILSPVWFRPSGRSIRTSWTLRSPDRASQASGRASFVQIVGLARVPGTAFRASPPGGGVPASSSSRAATMPGARCASASTTPTSARRPPATGSSGADQALGGLITSTPSTGQAQCFRGRSARIVDLCVPLGCSAERWRNAGRYPHQHRERHEPAGSIPACAGKPAPARTLCTTARVHPRVCGEAVFPFPATKPPTGPSPRVRGSRSTAASTPTRCRSIPACAGKPAAR